MSAPHEVFLQSRWFFEQPELPGFLTVGEPGSGVVPLFSSLQELARYAGACSWASTTGEDILSLLPDGYAIVVDVAGPEPVWIEKDTVRSLRLAASSGEGGTR